MADRVRFEMQMSTAQRALFEACRAFEGDKALAGWLTRAALRRARELVNQGKVPHTLLAQVVLEESQK